MILYDFKCRDCGESFEGFAKISEREKDCPNCGGVAARQVSTPRIGLDGTDPAFPTAWDRWAKQHEDAAKRAYQRDDLGGQYHGDN